MDENESILNSVKKFVGLEADYTPFDASIIMEINAAFMVLNQEGIGPDTPLIITDDSITWDYFTEGDPRLEGVKMLVGMKVKKIFDPPASSAAMESLDKLISEYEWRLYSLKDYA